MQHHQNVCYIHDFFVHMGGACKKWDQKAFSARLSLILYYREMNQKTLARKLKIAPTTLSAWQHRAENHPSLSKMIELAKVLKVPVCWMAFGCQTCRPKEVDLFLKQVDQSRRP